MPRKYEPIDYGDKPKKFHSKINTKEREEEVLASESEDYDEDEDDEDDDNEDNDNEEQESKKKKISFKEWRALNKEAERKNRYKDEETEEHFKKQETKRKEITDDKEIRLVTENQLFNAKLDHIILLLEKIARE